MVAWIKNYSSYQGSPWQYIEMIFNEIEVIHMGQEKKGKTGGARQEGPDKRGQTGGDRQEKTDRRGQMMKMQ